MNLSKFDLKIDLKICESCGALWLRVTPGTVYCRHCVSVLAEFPAAAGRRSERASRREAGGRGLAGRDHAGTRSGLSLQGGVR